MESLIRLVEAMGFWGWMAVIACTAIVVEAVVKIKIKRMKYQTVLSERDQVVDKDSDKDSGDEKVA